MGAADEKAEQDEEAKVSDDKGWKIGDVVDGQVSALQDKGAIVKLDFGKMGVLHISNISSEPIDKVADVMQPGSWIKAKIISIDTKNGRTRYSLDTKAFTSPE